MEIFPFTAKLESISTEQKKTLLGGKGANLNTMTTALNMPVPPGFTITTDACFIHEDLNNLSLSLADKIRKQVAILEKETNRKFGAVGKMPLLLSVRSGAPVSMPGMMDTILNLGLNDKSVGALARRTNEYFAWDSYKRFIFMYSTVVLGLEAEALTTKEKAVDEFFHGQKVPEKHQMTISLWKRDLARKNLKIPQSVDQQLEEAVMAVFKSWNGDRAKSYRRIEKISDDLGTAVNIQTMVFGNMNDKSGTGVAFTRNPNTGINERFGDFLVNAQGEDVVAGVAETHPLNEMKEIFPAQAEELEDIMCRLENHYCDMCDIEFTIEDDKLYILQTRTGKRNRQAAVAIAIDFLTEQKITKEDALSRINQALANTLPPPVFTESSGDKSSLLAVGVPASSGKAEGKIYFSSGEAVKASNSGENVILVRQETSPNDIDGMEAANGILTIVGGLVSHAAVVARAWEKPCVVGFKEGIITGSEQKFLSIQGTNTILPQGATIQINGDTGEVYLIRKENGE